MNLPCFSAQLRTTRAVTSLEVVSCDGAGLQQFKANKPQCCPRLDSQAAWGFDGFCLGPCGKPQRQRGNKVPRVTTRNRDRRYG